MNTILLATDGSEYARSAADRVLEIAAEHEAELHVVCVVDQKKYSEPALSSAELETIYAEEHAAMCVTDVIDMGSMHGVSVTGDNRHGIPHEVILSVADEVNADLIVVGEHGDHTKHFSGVGEKTRTSADRDVLVVEATGAEERCSSTDQ